MNLNRAIEILNKNKHRFAVKSLRFGFFWVSTYERGIECASLIRYEQSEDGGQSVCVLTSFEVIAIAEKYIRDEKKNRDDTSPGDSEYKYKLESEKEGE